MDNWLVPAAVIIGGLIIFSAKAAKTKGWQIIRYLFGFVGHPYGDDGITRIGYGTPAAGRESIEQDAAANETKAVLAGLIDEIKSMGGQAWPWALKIAYITLNYFGLPYSQDGTVNQNIAIIVNTMINAHSNGEYTEQDLQNIGEAITAVQDVLSPNEETIFDTIIYYVVKRYLPGDNNSE